MYVSQKKNYGFNTWLIKQDVLARMFNGFRQSSIKVNLKSVRGYILAFKIFITGKLTASLPVLYALFYGTF